MATTVSMLKQPFGAIRVVRNGGGDVTETRDYKKACIDAGIIAIIAALSILIVGGYPPTDEVFFSAFLAFLMGFFTSLARKLDIEIEG